MSRAWWTGERGSDDDKGTHLGLLCGFCAQLHRGRGLGDGAGLGDCWGLFSWSLEEFWRARTGGHWVTYLQLLENPS